MMIYPMQTIAQPIEQVKCAAWSPGGDGWGHCMEHKHGGRPSFGTCRVCKGFSPPPNAVQPVTNWDAVVSQIEHDGSPEWRARLQHAINWQPRGGGCSPCKQRNYRDRLIHDWQTRAQA